jgi:peptide/nickel transport system ATP-binding protein
MSAAQKDMAKNAPDARDRGGPAQPLLIVENLRKHFPVRGGLLNRQVATVQAVDDVSFSVRKGETLGIVGESGCGKSTTARLLMRLMEPDAGSVVFDGDQVGDKRGISVNDMRRQMQMVFQDSYSSLNPRMTMAESIAYAPRMHGLGRKEAYDRAEDLLARVGLNPRQYARRYPHELSGGQRQRVVIAGALVLEPQVLVADEPVASLDASVRGEILALLLRLRDELGLAALVVTHDLGLAWNIADRLAVMYLGRIVEVGTPEQVFSSPRHPYTRALMSVLPESSAEPIVLTGEPPDPTRIPAGCRFHPRCPELASGAAERAGVASDCRAAPLPVLPAAGPGSGALVSCHLAAALAERSS